MKTVKKTLKKTKKTTKVKLIVHKATKYEPWMNEAVIDVARNGGHVAQMCHKIGIKSFETFYRWLERYPKFKESYDESKLISQSCYEEIGFQGMLGQIKGFNFSTWAMIMNNKFSKDYKRSATGQSSGTEINIGTFNQLKQLDRVQLLEKAELLTKDLQKTTNGK